MTVSYQDFGLRNEDCCIQGQRNKDKYMAYQRKYREKYGVYPELDLKNEPFVAVWEDVYEIYRLMKRNDFYGKWAWHDYYNAFNKRLKKLYHEYDLEWSFIMCLDKQINLSMFKELHPMENIVNDLGVRVDENGNYYEGTWKNGNFFYGLMYNAKQDAFFVGGAVNVDNVLEYHGVLHMFDGKELISQMGIFFMSNGLLAPYRDECCSFEIEMFANGDTKSCVAYITPFADGYEEGRAYIKSYERDGIKIWSGVYKDGGMRRNGTNTFNKLLHLILMLYMTIYYMIKFTYGLPFVLIYRAYQKRNWK